MDRVTESLVREFKESYEIHESETAELFEHFVNFCVTTKENGAEDIELKELSTGPATQGIDGMAIIVNRKIVNSTDEIDNLIKLNKQINVKFVLIQSKTTASFDNSQISNLLNFATIFFSEENSLFTSEEMQKFVELKNHILNHSSKLEKNPVLNLYYVTVGNWTDDLNLNAVIETNIKTLESTNLFSDINFFPCGAGEIQGMYRKTKSELSATFKFEKRVTMYSISESELGYCGVLPFSEYTKIILDDNETLKPIFEDNIRDFLGLSQDVNKAIEDTVTEGNENAFSMMNNGVTIVANSTTLSGDIITMKDYQIVNGCQTSHILFQNRHVDGIDRLMIPIRIIATEDENLKNSITRATNNQTAIKKDQLEALSTFQKNLEEYYKTFIDDSQRLFYERRTGQYRNADIRRAKIVTIPMQIKAVTAMFLDNPSGVSGRYGTIAKNVGNKIFKRADRQAIYYTSALALYRIEALLNNSSIEKKFWKTRYHAMMLLRIIVGGEELPKFNQKKMDEYCQKILDVLNDENLCLKYYKGIVNYIASQAELDLNDRKTFERNVTAELLLKNISELHDYLENNIEQIEITE